MDWVVSAEGLSYAGEQDVYSENCVALFPDCRVTVGKVVLCERQHESPAASLHNSYNTFANMYKLEHECTHQRLEVDLSEIRLLLHHLNASN